MLTPWKKSYDQPRQPIKKQRYHFANKHPHSQSNDFSSTHVWMWGLDHKESWVLKNWCFWILVSEKRLLRVPWTAGRSNQSIQKEISSEYSLEGLMLKLHNFGHLMWRADLLEKTLMLGKIEGGRRRGQQRMRWSDGINESTDMILNELRGTAGDGLWPVHQVCPVAGFVSEALLGHSYAPSFPCCLQLPLCYNQGAARKSTRSAKPVCRCPWDHKVLDTTWWLTNKNQCK